MSLTVQRLEGRYTSDKS